MTWKAWSAALGVGALAPALIAAGAAAQTMSGMPAMHEPLIGHVLFDQLEYRVQDGEDIAAWDGQAWYGGDYNKIWFKTLGEVSGGDEVEQAEVQLLYSRLIGYYWDFQGGVRYDFSPDPSRVYGVIGLQGLAPGYFELDLQGFVSEEGDVSARLEAEYDLLITQRLVLQPKAEVNVAVQRVPELGIGRGINDVELGLRLRYEFVREFAPYIGVSWERRLGETADFAREEGEDIDNLAFVAGVRFWY
jgi:copper resistance protein B